MAERWRQHPDVQRLQRCLRAAEELLCVAPAVLRTANVWRKRHVWLGIGRHTSHEKCEHMVFVFSRARLPCLQGQFPQLSPTFASMLGGEFIFCVLPVAANVRFDTGEKSCSFGWTPSSQKSTNALGDCNFEDVQDSMGVLETLRGIYDEAIETDTVFHEEQRSSEVWFYRDMLPLHLAKLPHMPIRLPGLPHARAYASVPDLRGSAKKVAKLLLVTWNVGATEPKEGRDEERDELLGRCPDADLVCLGLQETCELTAKRLVKDGVEWTLWRDWASRGVDSVYKDSPLELLESCLLVGMLLLIFVKKDLRDQVSGLSKSELGIGVGGVGGNKGAVSIRFDLQTTSLCFVNAHLAAGQEQYIQRCQNFGTIMQKTCFGESVEAASDAADEALPQPVSGGPERLSSKLPKKSLTTSLVDADRDRAGSPAPRRHAQSFAVGESEQLSSVVKNTYSNPNKAAAVPEALTINKHDHIIWLGDTNSRLHWPGKAGGVPIDQAMQWVQEHRIGELLALDQLNFMRREGLAFDGFEESTIRFLPSYKWRKDGDALDMRTQKHVPAWCDRILFKSAVDPPITVNKYDIHLGLKQSDHRPVYACCTLRLDGRGS